MTHHHRQSINFDLSKRKEKKSCCIADYRWSVKNVSPSSKRTYLCVCVCVKCVWGKIFPLFISMDIKLTFSSTIIPPFTNFQAKTLSSDDRISFRNPTRLAFLSQNFLENEKKRWKWKWWRAFPAGGAQIWRRFLGTRTNETWKTHKLFPPRLRFGGRTKLLSFTSPCD